MMPGMISLFRILWFLLPILIVLFIGCTSDTQRIREANEAARVSQTKAAAGITPTIILTPTSIGSPAVGSGLPTAEASPTPLVTDINVLDVREGDCINSRLTEGYEVETVEIVTCSADWNFRVLNLFTVEAGSRFPGDEYFSQQAFVYCDARYTFMIIPTRESWGLGDRTISCLQDNFGLEIEQLDRLVGTQSLNIGQCLNQAPETNFELVELVSCESHWGFRLLDSFVLQDGPFPGDDYIMAQSNENCDRKHGLTYGPSAETWRHGDRTVLCMQASYGLAPTNTELLERLVNLYSLTHGECFNDAPEANLEMVELVDCLGAWEYRTLNIFEVSADGTYPGEAYFDRQAAQQCDRNYDWTFSPTTESWQQGDRAVICLTGS